MIIDHLQTCPKSRYQFELVRDISLTLAVPVDCEATFQDIGDAIRDEWANFHYEPDADSDEFTEALDELWARYMIPDFDATALYDPGSLPPGQSDLVAVFRIIF